MTSSPCDAECSHFVSMERLRASSKGLGAPKFGVCLRNWIGWGGKTGMGQGLGWGIFQFKNLYGFKDLGRKAPQHPHTKPFNMCFQHLLCTGINKSQVLEGIQRIESIFCIVGYGANKLLEMFWEHYPFITISGLRQTWKSLLCATLCLAWHVHTCI